MTLCAAPVAAERNSPHIGAWLLSRWRSQKKEMTICFQCDHGVRSNELGNGLFRRRPARLLNVWIIYTKHLSLCISYTALRHLQVNTVLQQNVVFPYKFELLTLLICLGWTVKLPFVQKAKYINKFVNSFYTSGFQIQLMPKEAYTLYFYEFAEWFLVMHQLTYNINEHEMFMLLAG